MSKFLGLSSKTILIVSLFALLFAAAETSAFATAQYRVWYFDDVFDGTFQEGDISDGWTKLIPPSWACGMRFNDPTYYRWVDGNVGSTITDGDLWKDVNVWIPKAGCPETSDPLIEYTDGSATFPHQLGASYMEIWTNYAVHWINEDGVVPPCNCTGFDDFVYLPLDTGGRVIGDIATLKSTLLHPKNQTLVADSIAAVAVKVELLHTALQNQIAERRRTDLGDLEVSVRSLEDNASRRLEDALAALGACEEVARRSEFCDAHVACDLGAESVSDAESLLATAQFFFQNQTSQP